MDKITRILTMYAKLMRGEHIRKLDFCIETECNARSFDRDIEDVRLYLSELFQTDELLYDRMENTYYLSGIRPQKLRQAEFRFLSGVLTQSGLLRGDELSELMEHLLSNTDNPAAALPRLENDLQHHIEAGHKQALLKMHDDLLHSIDRHLVIELHLHQADEEMKKQAVIPCRLIYPKEGVSLVALDPENHQPEYFLLKNIDSFAVLQTQSRNEQVLVQQYSTNSNINFPYDENGGT